MKTRRKWEIIYTFETRNWKKKTWFHGLLNSFRSCINLINTFLFYSILVSIPSTHPNSILFLYAFHQRFPIPTFLVPIPSTFPPFILPCTHSINTLLFLSQEFSILFRSCIHSVNTFLFLPHQFPIIFRSCIHSINTFLFPPSLYPFHQHMPILPVLVYSPSTSLLFPVCCSSSRPSYSIPCLPLLPLLPSTARHNTPHSHEREDWLLT